jgi:(p)ppGpp synthase/HD superfamily hydrolase
VKLADRIDNLRAVTRSGDPEKARRYLAVSLDEFVPLAEQTDQRATQLVLEACDAIAQYLKDGTAAGLSEG